MQATLIMEGGYFMATTRLMPLHTGKGRTVGTAISDIIDYVQNPQKTDNGRLITSYQCDSRIADAEFLFNKRQYIAATGRVRGEDDVIAYHLRQSFVPGEITPEEANRLGCELARRFTKGKHAFIVCTHIDRKHIHNHIIFDATALDYQRKFRNFGAAPARSGGSMTPSALRTDTLLWRTRSHMERAITSGWGIGPNSPSGRRCG